MISSSILHCVLCSDSDSLYTLALLYPCPQCLATPFYLSLIIPYYYAATFCVNRTGWATPTALSQVDIRETIDDFVKCATLAQTAGYDGVEIMGSEG